MGELKKRKKGQEKELNALKEKEKIRQTFKETDEYILQRCYGIIMSRYYIQKINF